MKQIITIEGLECEAIIGVYKQELEVTQPLIIHLSLEIDAAPAIASDNLRDTLDYDALSKHICTFVARNRYGLLEKLMAALLGELAKFDKLISAGITIEKPQALAAYGAMVSLSSEWKRGD